MTSVKNLLHRIALLSCFVTPLASLNAAINVPSVKTDTCCTGCEGEGGGEISGNLQKTFSAGGAGLAGGNLGNYTIQVRADKPSAITFSPGSLGVTTGAGIPAVMDIHTNSDGSTKATYQECQKVSVDIPAYGNPDDYPLTCNGKLLGEETITPVSANLMGGMGLSSLMAVQSNPVGTRVIFIKNPDGSEARYAKSTGELISYRDTAGRTITLSELPQNARPEIIQLDGALRQVKTAQGLADIQRLPGEGQGYVIRYYDAAQVGAKQADGTYSVSGEPQRSLKVENPDWQNQRYTAAQVTETTGNLSRTNSYSYNEASREWTQTLPDGTKIVRRETLPQNTVPPMESGLPAPSTTALNHFIRTKERYDAQGKLIGTTRHVIWLTKDNLERVLQEIKDYGGLNYATTYSYYQDASQPKVFARLKSKLEPTGNWEYHVYDNQGRVTKTYTPWLDTLMPTAVPGGESGCRVSEYSYAPVASGDTVQLNDQRARISIQRINGIETGRTYYAYTTQNGARREIEERAVAQGVSFGYTGNLRVTTSYYSGTAGEASAGKVKSIEQPDGRLTTYSYALNPNSADTYLSTTITDGTVTSPQGIAGKTTRRIRTQNKQGRTVREEMQAYIGGDYVRANLTEKRYDEDGHLVESKKDGRTVYNATYANDQLVSEIDEIGITTSYTYDLMGGVATATRQPVGDQPARVTTYNRTLGGIDCGCDGSLQVTLSAGDLTLTTRTVKDKVGRLVEQVDAAGLMTTYAYTNGGRIITILQPNTATQIIEKHLDGQGKSQTGTGVIAQYKSYGVNGDGTRWEKTNLAKADSPRWTKTTVGFLGQALRTEKPGFAGAIIAASNAYDTQGRLNQTTQTVTGGTVPFSTGSSLIVATIYTRDNLSNAIAVTVTRGGISNVTESDSVYSVNNGVVWRDSSTKKDGITTQRQRSRVRLRQDSASETLSVGVPESNQAGFTWDSAATANRSIVTIDRGMATQTTTIKLPGSIQPQIQTMVGGLLVSSVSASHGGTTLYKYDALGRQTVVKQPRHQNYSSTVYNAQGQIETDTDAAGNTTAFAYYGNGETGAGLLRQKTDPLGGTVFHHYDLQGREVYTWGSATYPTAQGYTVYGQRSYLRTSRDASANFTTGIFPTNAQMDTTTWIYDEATEALLHKVHADGKGPSYTYYADGQLRTRTWARRDSQNNPLSTTYIYTPQGQLAKVDYSDDTPDVIYSYNTFGQPTQVTDGTGARTYEYDPQTHALVAETFSGMVSGTLQRAHDVYNRPVAIALADTDYQISYDYDSTGRLRKIGEEYTYGYLPNSDLIATLDSPAHTVENDYETNRDNLLTKINRLKSGTVVSQYTYTVNTLGQRVTRTQTGSAVAQASTDVFGYNSRSEVTSSTNSQNTALSRNYNYDPIGNRVSAAEPGNGIAQSYTANALNQYTHINADSQASSLVFDADGNLLTDDTGKTYAWDGENRLAQISLSNGEVIRYAYDGQSRRVKREHVSGTTTATTTYLHDGWNVIREISGDRLKSYTWGLDLSNTTQRAGGIGGLLSIRDSSIGSVYYFYDGNGNVCGLVDSNGTLQARYWYDACGTTVFAEGTYAQSNTYRHGSKSWDDAVEGYYYGFRIYQPMFGRWINRDPIEEQGGDNLYLMAKNNLINNWDYLGLLPDWFIRCFINSCHDACAQAKNKGLDRGDAGGVICCNGQKFFCNWSPNGIPIEGEVYNPRAATILSACVLEHENEHDNDAECDPAQGDNLHRTHYGPDADVNARECAAFEVEIKCIESRIDNCEGDPDCLRLVFKALEFIKNDMKRKYKCTNF